MKSILLKRIGRGDGLFNILPWVVLVALLYASVGSMLFMDTINMGQEWRYRNGTENIAKAKGTIWVAKFNTVNMSTSTSTTVTVTRIRVREISFE